MNIKAVITVCVIHIWRKKRTGRGWYNKGMVRIHRERGGERGREGTEEKGGRQAEKRSDVTFTRQPMRAREGERERAAKGGCVFLSLQHQQRGEGYNQFHREKEEKGSSR